MSTVIVFIMDSLEVHDPWYDFRVSTYSVDIVTDHSGSSFPLNINF